MTNYPTSKDPSVSEGKGLVKASSRALSLTNAQSTKGVLLLGGLAVNQLLTKGVCAYFVNASGTIELVHPIELALDYLPEDQALRILLNSHQYTDSQLIAYLKGREARSPLGGERPTNGTHL